MHLKFMHRLNKSCVGATEWSLCPFKKSFQTQTRVAFEKHLRALIPFSCDGKQNYWLWIVSNQITAVHLSRFESFFAFALAVLTSSTSLSKIQRPHFNDSGFYHKSLLMHFILTWSKNDELNELCEWRRLLDGFNDGKGSEWFVGFVICLSGV